jgi:hypothetical protein
MKFNITRLGPVLATGAAALSLSAAPRLIAPSSAGAMPVDAKKCTPGQIREVGGKKYVCNKSGRWVHVLDLAGGVVSVTVGGTLSTGQGATTGGPSSGFTPMETNNGGSSVTCDGGGKPGDVNTVVVITYVNGRYVSKKTSSMICGDDGKWHTVARVTIGSRQVSAVVITVVR